MQCNDIAIQSCGEDAIFDIVFTGQEIKNYRDGLSGNSTLMDRFNLECSKMAS
ncbi:MAG: hypothetical protein CM1200mP35_00470 [Chloroflexota bacterium]|nr:MAG: hypothetical protein CM1200mP35_00470 [Chloroflexota bacterium]